MEADKHRTAGRFGVVACHYRSASSLETFVVLFNPDGKNPDDKNPDGKQLAEIAATKRKGRSATGRPFLQGRIVPTEA
jgi:hypothetical protein